MSSDGNKKPSIVVVELDDGRRMEIDAASEVRDVPMYEKMQYVGAGYYYSINGKRGSSVHPSEKHHFWINKNRRVSQ